MKSTAIALTELRRWARDRSNAFFVFILPLAIVLLVGLQFGEAAPAKLAVVAPTGAELAEEVIALLDDHERIDVVRRDDPDSAVDAVGRGELAAALVFPVDLDSRLAAGEVTDVGFTYSTTGLGPQLQTVVNDAVSRAIAIPTAVAAAVERGADPAEAATAASAQAGLINLVGVVTTTTGERLFPEDLTGYDVGAAGQVVLFVFLTSLTGSVTMIQSRQLGVTTRMLSTPTRLSTLITGEAVSRFCIAVTQGIYIMVATVVLFDVNWGNLLASAAILIMFGAVGAAAAMLTGASFSTVEQASGVTVVVGLVLGALGGSMLPVELFSDTMLTIARAIPHYWALDAFAEVVRHDATIVDIWPQLGVLGLFALGLGSVAVWRLRLTLTTR